MADDVQTLKNDIAELVVDVRALVGVIGGLKTNVTDLTAQLAAAKAAGFTVPQDLLDAANAAVTEADKAVADATAADAPATVTVTDGGATSGNP